MNTMSSICYMYVPYVHFTTACLSLLYSSFAEFYIHHGPAAVTTVAMETCGVSTENVLNRSEKDAESQADGERGIKKRA